MGDDRLSRKRRNLPHWALAGGVYFVTFRVAVGKLNAEEQEIVLRHLLERDGRFYILSAAVVMPDHVHLLIKPLPPYDLSRVMKGVKGVSARKINVHRHRTGRVWQNESWDRLVRDVDEFEEKLRYMADNPVKAELVKRLEEYPFWYCHKELL